MFVATSARPVVEEYLTAVYDDIGTQLTEQMDIIQQSRQALEDEVNSAVNNMTKFMENIQVDAGLVR